MMYDGTLVAHSPRACASGGGFLSEGAAMAMARDALAAARADFRAMVCEDQAGRVSASAWGEAISAADRAGYPPVRHGARARVLALPVVACARAGGGARVSRAPVPVRAAGAVCGAGAGGSGSARRSGYGLSWPGAQTMFIVAVMGLAIVAAGLELLTL